MSRENYIALAELCTYYQVELSFFGNLNEMGLIEISTIEEVQYIEEEKIGDLEKIIRMQRELDLNLESIDVVFNLLNRIYVLQDELIAIKNRLRLYEKE